ncbi:hypothetical protein BLNAU_592 [Blattamonas nauphoetae]|uniref:Uncharacterized protein n=1 Tax=Blattamonas nauphoetae TaxID=2049346 RepID=A0ABQ9YLP1_9EUKA|nr:hypothetical protein BLNAU_592 [Blattamonas nauphoetae]
MEPLSPKILLKKTSALSQVIESIHEPDSSHDSQNPIVQSKINEINSILSYLLDYVPGQLSIIFNFPKDQDSLVTFTTANTHTSWNEFRKSLIHLLDVLTRILQKREPIFSLWKLSILSRIPVLIPLIIHLDLNYSVIFIREAVHSIQSNDELEQSASFILLYRFGCISKTHLDIVLASILESLSSQQPSSSTLDRKLTQPLFEINDQSSSLAISRTLQDLSSTVAEVKKPPFNKQLAMSTVSSGLVKQVLPLIGELLATTRLSRIQPLKTAFTVAVLDLTSVMRDKTLIEERLVLLDLLPSVQGDTLFPSVQQVVDTFFANPISPQPAIQLLNSLVPHSKSPYFSALLRSVLFIVQQKESEFSVLSEIKPSKQKESVKTEGRRMMKRVLEASISHSDWLEKRINEADLAPTKTKEIDTFRINCEKDFAKSPLALFQNQLERESANPPPALEKTKREHSTKPHKKHKKHFTKN